MDVDPGPADLQKAREKHCDGIGSVCMVITKKILKLQTKITKSKLHKDKRIKNDDLKCLMKP